MTRMMNGFLSEPTKDLITIIGLALSIFQIVLASIPNPDNSIALTRRRRASGDFRASEQEERSGHLSRFLGNWRHLKDEDRMLHINVARVFVASILLGLFGAYVAFPLSQSDPIWPKSLATGLCVLTIFVHWFCLPWFLALVEELVFYRGAAIWK
jgi:hypothetical protein